MHLEFRHLRTIRAIHQAGGLARAAEILNMTQSALSHQVKGLEDQAGIELFVRRSKPMRLSAAGLRMLKLAERILPEIAALEEEFRALGYANIHVRCGNGREGWAEHAPYHRVMVTAAAHNVPAALLDQLAEDGRLVAPVGEGWLGQDLIVVEKEPGGSLSRRTILPVSFVPLVGSTR